MPKRKIGLICPSNKELAPYFAVLSDCKVTEKAKLRFYEKEFDNLILTAVYSGVGKANAAMCAQILIDQFGVDSMVISGTSGAMDGRLAIGDIAVSLTVAHHDLLPDFITHAHPFRSDGVFVASQELLEMTERAVAAYKGEQKIYFGRMVTGDTFIDKHGRPEINARFSPLCTDMETAAIAQVCEANGAGFVAIRGISNTPEYSGFSVFEDNCAQASRSAFLLVWGMLTEIGAI